jgi:hypothetical protein
MPTTDSETTDHTRIGQNMQKTTPRRVMVETAARGWEG